MEKSLAIHMLEIVADGLKGLKRQVVFVGGATVALYVDDVAVATPRPTDDVDCTVEISSRSEYYELENEIRKLGFKNQVGKGPICRWTYSGVTVDIIPSDGKVLGFKNSWYPEGIATSEKVTLPNKTQISIFTLPYFVASKFEAYQDRGKGDLRTSSDIEDIVFVLDGCQLAQDKLKSAPGGVKNFLKATCKKLASDPNFYEAINAHIGDERSRSVRSKRIIEILKQL
ncbi:MAG: nucleotidyl transferase AbiEii/AbiGii toxin family protein [Deltaproteobacteria bacterium]|nr:nucleotidyl transferase AbiEii/AbiGii toxin family protein [Deltaproteobacteria bacterium]